MKFDYMVKRNGIYYPAGTDVPESNLGSKSVEEVVIPKAEEPKEEKVVKEKVAPKKTSKSKK